VLGVTEITKAKLNAAYTSRILHDFEADLPSSNLGNYYIFKNESLGLERLLACSSSSQSSGCCPRSLWPLQLSASRECRFLTTTIQVRYDDPSRRLKMAVPATIRILRLPIFDTGPQCLTVTDAVVGDGSLVHAVPCSSTTGASKWDIMAGDNLSVRLTNTNYCLDAGLSEGRYCRR
jgi:hypothetical protein